jgi:23S rRNA (cytidine1920-2'-O)/16S rRNA (cytidine1409-2'-O)-methyltransferase
MSSSPPPPAFVSRGGDKLSAALDHFEIDVTGRVCADLGSHVGGFVDCLLRRGAARVYSIDTAYGTLAWRLRKDARVVVHERTNAMHATLAEPVHLVTIDVGWTTQARVLRNVARMLHVGGFVVTLIKPHYEAPKELLVDGVLPELALDEVLAAVRAGIESLGWSVRDTMTSPIRGHGGNREVLAFLSRP